MSVITTITSACDHKGTTELVIDTTSIAWQRCTVCGCSALATMTMGPTVVGSVEQIEP